ncbi:hypothetical protein LguiA_006516 [Lonicera macranthoides]
MVSAAVDPTANSKFPFVARAVKKENIPQARLKIEFPSFSSQGIETGFLLFFSLFPSPQNMNPNEGCRKIRDSMVF